MSKISPPVIDTDVHEMYLSIKDLVPYLDEPWRSRVAVADGWKPQSLPYSWPLIGGVARADAALPNGKPAGSDYQIMKTQHLDPNNIEAAVLTGLFYPTEMKVQPQFASGLARAYNDWTKATWLSKDSRFKGSICIAAQEPHVAAEEIDRVAEDPRYVQVILPALTHDVLGREFYHPIFDAAQRNNLVVAFHQGYSTQTAVGLPPYYIEWHTAIPQAWQCQLVGLIAHGVFDKYPGLRVALIESSWTWLPSLMWRFDHNYRSLRREIPWVKRMPSELIRENVRVSTQPMEFPDNPEHLFQLFEMIGTDEFLMYSSDYPHWDYDDPGRALPAIFPKDLRHKINYENAKKLYGI
ncbi:amidohydrolase family protein [Rhodococcus opacus]|uniref:amidohydrolase family protein n=1 Tax=Rhodococcus opacus TaxID=37919 RepID=UPI0022360B14|nr:amidohydrolase family protein [Rhodococcus opacus]UZG60368.1 amidohydrolase [Rhodococcus opacus]